jgi:dethiobiotin synthetase
MAPRILFITGTDTGVGKTLLTALLLRHLRARGANALALKPFCSGGRADAELLYQLQDGLLTLDEVNPFHFAEPVAPLASARKHRRNVPLDAVLQHINSIASRKSHSAVDAAKASTEYSTLNTQKYLLIEGSGGLLVPLGEVYSVRDLVRRLGCEVIVVSQNRLGTINHTLLTVEALTGADGRASGSRGRLQLGGSSLPRVVLMDAANPDLSSRSNAALLSELLTPVSLVRLPFLGKTASSARAVRQMAPKLASQLERILAPGPLSRRMR